MKFELADPIPVPTDSLRTVKKFLLFPRILRNMETNRREFRWLEFAIIQQSWGVIGDDGVGGALSGWVDDYFV